MADNPSDGFAVHFSVLKSFWFLIVFLKDLLYFLPMRFWVGLFSVIVLLFCGGCKDFKTPVGVLAVAYQAIAEDDLKLFISTLRDSALQQYGNEAGICQFQRILLGKNSELGDARLVGIDYDPCQREVRRTFEVPILGRDVNAPQGTPLHPLIDSTVICEIAFTEVHPRFEGALQGAGDCSGSFRKTIFCQISELR